MITPIVQGRIDRRILVNYRIDPSVVAPILPAPFRPKTIRGAALVGICLIRLKGVRPRLFPAWLGISSENAAHRIAVEWNDGDVVREGVFIPRRDTNSHLNTLAGGRLFPGIHHHARFKVNETPERLEVAYESDDRSTRVAVAGCPTDVLPDTSVFGSMEEASAFFQAGSRGYSVTSDPSRFHGLELKCRDWQIEPLAVESVESSFFEDHARFPAGSVEFDCALLMRNIEHEWHAQPDLASPRDCRCV